MTPSLASLDEMVSIKQPFYGLHSESQLKWTATQEKALNREYPFGDLHAENAEQYVQRTYLQFLWLPEVRPSCVAVFTFHHKLIVKCELF